MDSSEGPSDDERIVGLPDAGITEATRRTRALIDYGYPIQFMSTQLAFVLIIMVMGLLAAIASPDLNLLSVAPAFSSYVVGLALAVAGYVMARRNHQLIPVGTGVFTQDHLEPLSSTQRTILMTQLRGTQPIIRDFADLIAAMAEFSRHTTRGSLLPLSGMFVTICALGFVVVPAITIGAIAAAVILTIVSTLERRRWSAVEKRLTDLPRSEPSAT